jgi:hypothetical protein
MARRIKLNRLLGILTSLVTLGAAFPAAAECPKLADVEWWTNTVDEVRQVVVKTYEGSWDSYIDRWQLQRKELQDAYNRGTAVEIRTRGLTFRDEDLKNYIKMVDERIETLRCMKAEYGDERTADQKAGKGGAPAAPTQEVVKSVEGQNFDLEVSAVCQNGIPAFQVTNLGDRWPKLGEVSIYRTDTKAMLIQRRVRMANSQQMIFKVPDEIAKDADEVGIFIEPSWYQRTFGYDATIKC